MEHGFDPILLMILHWYRFCSVEYSSLYLGIMDPDQSNLWLYHLIYFDFFNHHFWCNNSSDFHLKSKFHQLIIPIINSSTTKAPVYVHSWISFGQFNSYFPVQWIVVVSLITQTKQTICIQLITQCLPCVNALINVSMNMKFCIIEPIQLIY